MRSKRLAVWSLVAAIVGASVAVSAPLGQVTEYLDGPGGGETRSYSVSLISSEGVWVLVVVAVPILIALAGALIPARAARIVSTALLWAFCVLGLLTIGIFFVPAAVLMTAAAAVGDRQQAPGPA